MLKRAHALSVWGLAAVLLLVTVSSAVAAVGDFKGAWGSLGASDGEMNYPADVAISSAGDVYVIEDGNHRVQWFGPTGTYKGKWGSLGSENEQLAYPWALSVAPNGDVYVADTGNDRIQYFGPTGAFKGTWGSSGTGDGEFGGPKGVAVAPNGDVYVVDTDNSRVQYFGPTGSFKGEVTASGTESSAILGESLSHLTATSTWSIGPTIACSGSVRPGPTRVNGGTRAPGSVSFPTRMASACQRMAMSSSPIS